MADYSLLVNVEAIDKASAVFDKISKNVGTFKKDLEGAGTSGKTSMESLGQSMQQVGTKMTATGKVMTATVTTPIVALGTAAVKTAADFDSQMSKVQAISGATGKDMQSLRDKAREMGAKTKFSATEAGQGFEYMAMAGWKTGDMLDGIEGIMNLAAASGENLGTTSDIVTDALTAFGLSAKDSGHFADVLAAASSNANTNVSMMGETFKYAAPIAGSLGYSAEDTALAIGLMANSGIKASQAGTSLRTIMTKLTGDVKISGKALGDVTIATANADGTMRPFKDILMDCRDAFSKLTDEEKVSAAESLVGKNAMSGFLALMNAGEADVNKLTKALDGCDGAAEDMANTMNDNLEGQLTILKSQLQELAISFGEILIPAVRSAVTVLQNIVDWFNKIPAPIKEVITKVLAVVAAIGPLLLVGGKIVSGIGSIITVASKMGTVFTTIKTVAGALGGGLQALWGVLMANPIVLVIAAVAALVAGFIYLWNNCEEFRQFWINLWEGIKSVVSAAWQAITTALQTAWTAISTAAQTVWNAISQFFVGLWEGIKTVFTTAVTAIGTALTTAWTTISTAVTTAWTAISTFFSTTWDTIKTTVSTAVDAVKTGLSTAWDNIKTKASTTWDNIKTHIGTAWDNIKTKTGTTVETIKTNVTNGWAAMKSNIGTAMENIKTVSSNAWNNIKSVASTAMTNIRTAVSNGLSAVRNTASSILNGVSNTFTSVFNGIRSHVSGVVSWLKGIFNFSWSLPHIKLPHFSISGSFSLNPPSIPHFSVSWYKSAYDEAMIFQQPTVFGANGFGDGNGSEVVVGDQHLIDLIREAFGGGQNMGGGDMIFPIYIGQERIDEIVVRASQRQALLSGGR